MNISTIVFNGIDDTIDLNSQEYQTILKTSFHHYQTQPEYGILYHKTKKGTPRYSSFRQALKIIDSVGYHTYMALHVCGAESISTVLKGTYASDPELGALVSQMLEIGGRIQLNFRDFFTSGNYELADLINLLHRNPDTRFILPFNKSNEALFKLLIGYANVIPLVDSSGGKGKAPEVWTNPDPWFRNVRFAGGLGENNLAEQVVKIQTDTGRNYFGLDMESSLRTKDNTFDLAACDRIIRYMGK